MRKTIIYSVLILIVSFLLAQIIPTHRPETEPRPVNSDFITVVSPSQKTGSLIRAACYDCHSNETIYPWYSKVAPVSWWIIGHVREGREDLDFSHWTSYNSEKKLKLLKKCAGELKKGKMPLAGYPMMHKPARLSAGERDSLQLWFTQMAEHESGVFQK